MELALLGEGVLNALLDLVESHLGDDSRGKRQACLSTKGFNPHPNIWR